MSTVPVNKKILDFNVLSLNTRGLKCNKKRRKVYKWLSKQKGQNGVTFLQETHSTQSTENYWKHLWAGSSYFNHGSSNSRGVMILIGKYLDFELKEKIIDTEGRLLILSCLIQNEPFLLVNIYAPNTEREQIKFYNEVHETISNIDMDLSTNIIMGGGG